MTPEIAAKRQDLARKGFSPEETTTILRKSGLLPKARKRLASGHLTEHEEQKRIMDWAKKNRKALPALGLLFAVPNAGKRTQAQAAWLKAEGLRAGVPDLWLPVARGGFHGLAIELKPLDKTKKTTPEQDEWLAALAGHGYCAVVCRGHQDAVSTISRYLEAA